MHGILPSTGQPGEGNTFSFSLDTKGKAPAPQARKLSPSTQKRNYLRRQKFLASKSKLQDDASEEPADISVSLDANDSQDVTLSQKEDLSANTFRCDNVITIQKPAVG